MDEHALFAEIAKIIKTDENYVPRNYPSIGGIWTVDTWKKGEATYQLMDEGYTAKIVAPSLEVYKNYPNAINFAAGDITTLQITLAALKEVG